MLRAKNWRVSLHVLEFHHPPLNSSRQTTGRPVPSWVPFYLVLDFYWLGQHRVALIAYQP